ALKYVDRFFGESSKRKVEKLLNLRDEESGQIGETLPQLIDFVCIPLVCEFVCTVGDLLGDNPGLVDVFEKVEKYLLTRADNRLGKEFNRQQTLQKLKEYAFKSYAAMTEKS